MHHPGLYVHIPFCRSKCPYCGFASVPSLGLVPRWRDAVKKEISGYSKRFPPFDSLYLGGGTPTVLGLSVLGELMDALRAGFSFTADTETTIEANPCDLDRDTVAGLRALGIDRVSVGVQSFDDRVLAVLGRNHRADGAERAIGELGRAGFEHVCIDLMFGLRLQPLDGWMRTLREALSFEPEHVSCYQLTFEPNTPFELLRKRGTLEGLDEDDECSFFLETSRFMEGRGYTHYEVSNFARGERNVSRHNMKYWTRIPYLGLGPSAHSFDGVRRWWNLRSVRGYCRSLEEGALPVEGRERLSVAQIRSEKVALGIRTRNGVRLADVSHDAATLGLLSTLRASGHLEIRGDRVVPTAKGYLVADHLAVRLSE